MAENIELRQELDTELIHIIVQVPKDAVAVSFDAKLLQGEELVTAHMDMSAENFRQARKDFLDNVEFGDDYDKVWTLTEKGKKLADALAKKEGDDKA